LVIKKYKKAKRKTKLAKEDFAKQLRGMENLAKRELAEAVADGVLTGNQARGLLSGQLKKINEVNQNGNLYLEAGEFNRASQSFLLAARRAARFDFYESEAKSLKLALDALRKANAPVEQRKIVRKKYASAVAKIGEMEMKFKRMGL
jgi:hypothetical protein